MIKKYLVGVILSCAVVGHVAATDSGNGSFNVNELSMNCADSDVFKQWIADKKLTAEQVMVYLSRAYEITTDNAKELSSRLATPTSFPDTQAYNFHCMIHMYQSDFTNEVVTCVVELSKQGVAVDGIENEDLKKLVQNRLKQESKS